MDAPTETPDEKAARLRARKCEHQRQRRSRPPGTRVYKVKAVDATVEALLEWRQLLLPSRPHVDVETALQKLIDSLRGVSAGWVLSPLIVCRPCRQ